MWPRRLKNVAVLTSFHLQMNKTKVRCKRVKGNIRSLMSHYKPFTQWGAVLMTAELSSSCSTDIKSDINNNLPVMILVCKHVLTQIRLRPPGGAAAPPDLSESRRVCSSQSAAAIPRLFKEAVALRLSLRNAALITHAGPANVQALSLRSTGCRLQLHAAYGWMQEHMYSHSVHACTWELLR